MNNGISGGVGMAAAEEKAQVHSDEDSVEHLSRGVWSLESVKIRPPATSGSVSLTASEGR